MRHFARNPVCGTKSHLAPILSTYSAPRPNRHSDMRVGRSHIAATVNTLVLAYLGASLPLLLLFALSGEPPLTIASGEIVAVEVVRALVGSIGVVAAVPITTLVAAWPRPDRARGRD